MKCQGTAGRQGGLRVQLAGRSALLSGLCTWSATGAAEAPVVSARRITGASAIRLRRGVAGRHAASCQGCACTVLAAMSSGQRPAPGHRCCDGPASLHGAPVQGKRLLNQLCSCP